MSRVATLQQSITRHIVREDEPRQKPLDFRLIARLMDATRPYGRKRFWLLVSVVIRAVQLPALTWFIAAVIRGPISNKDSAGVIQSAIGFALLAISTQFIMHYRQRLALELGESVVADLRNQLFRHMQRMPMRWFHTNRIGRVISRMTSDVEDIRIGVQEVFYVTLVQFIQMGIAATAMIWYDWSLFLIVLGLAPVIWLINHHFHRRLSNALRNMRESFSRVTATLVESVVGIRVTQGHLKRISAGIEIDSVVCCVVTRRMAFCKQSIVHIRIRRLQIRKQPANGNGIRSADVFTVCNHNLLFP